MDKELCLRWGKPKAKPWYGHLASSCRREPGDELTAREDVRCPNVPYRSVVLGREPMLDISHRDHSAM